MILSFLVERRLPVLVLCLCTFRLSSTAVQSCGASCRDSDHFDDVTLLQGRTSAVMGEDYSRKDSMSRAEDATIAAAPGNLKLVFGVMTSWKPKYAEQTKAVEETWAQDVPPHQLLVVGKSGSGQGIMYDKAPKCIDGHTGNNGNACKEATIIADAYDLGADWVVVGASDMYVFPRRWEEVLKKQNATESKILGVHQCGEGQYCRDHKNGLCGGASYAVSRGAMAAIMKNRGANASQSYVQECMDTAVAESGNWSDQTTSCVARRYGVTEVEFPGLIGCQLHSSSTAGTCNSGDFEENLYSQYIAASDPIALTFHYIYPDAMHKIHKIAKETAAKQAMTQTGLSSLSMREAYAVHKASFIEFANAELRR